MQEVYKPEVPKQWYAYHMVVRGKPHGSMEKKYKFVVLFINVCKNMENLILLYIELFIFMFVHFYYPKSRKYTNKQSVINWLTIMSLIPDTHRSRT